MSDIDFLVDALCGSGNETSYKEVDIFAKALPAKVNSAGSFESEIVKPSKYSDYGQQVSSIMKAQNAGKKRKWTQDDEVNDGWCDLQAPNATSQKTSGKTSGTCFVEPNSKIAIENAKIPANDLAEKLSDKKVICLTKITPSSVPNPKQGQNWVTFGVIARKLPPKESAKGRPFSVWYLTDLNDLDRLETLFLFGAAHEAHWKLPERAAIGLLNPDVKEDREKGQTRFTLSIDHPLKLLVLGHSRDFAVCSSHTKSGENCTKIVNKAKSEFCVFHAMTLLKKGAKRPELAAYGSNSFLTNMKRPRTDQAQIEQKRVASSITASAFGPCLIPGKAPIIDSAPSMSGGGNASISSGLPSANKIKSLLPSSGPGVMNVEKLEEKAKLSASMSKYQINSSNTSQAEKIDTTSWGRHMLQAMEAKMNAPSSVAKARREKLAALIRSGQEAAPVKVDPNRPALHTASPKLDIISPNLISKENKIVDGLGSPKSTKTFDEAKKILETRSRHSNAVEDAFTSRQEAYFKALEPRDRAEQQLSETTKIKVKAVICKTCLYVASSAADRCKKEHPKTIVGPIDAWRRFFACRECSFRTTTFSRFPDQPCVRCHSSRWKAAPVRDMAKASIEKLSIGVEELPFYLEGGGDNDDDHAPLDYGINHS